MLDKETSTSAPLNPMYNLIELTLDKGFNLQLHVDSWILLGAGIVLALIFFRAFIFFRSSWRTFEIDQAELGLGNQKIKLSPNLTDQQIAYKIWVELSTRKIGIPIDLENDVISELYDSWFNFFSVTRELIKDVPVQKFRRNGTEKIVSLSIEVLNQGIRPHLTLWQARFRRWYENQLNLAANSEISPQDIQKNFSQFLELQSDLLVVNQRLMTYRQKMYEIVTAT